MSTTPYLPEIEDALSSHAILHLIDVTSEIRHIANINGPAGRLLGKRVMEYMDKFEGRSFEDLTVKELNALMELNRIEYNERYTRSMEAAR